MVAGGILEINSSFPICIEMWMKFVTECGLTPSLPPKEVKLPLSHNKCVFFVDVILYA